MACYSASAGGNIWVAQLCDIAHGFTPVIWGLPDLTNRFEGEDYGNLMLPIWISVYRVSEYCEHVKHALSAFSSLNDNVHPAAS